MLNLMLDFNIRFYPSLISSRANKLADAASRGALDELNELLPTWTAYAPRDLRVRLPNHTRPGPLFLWKKGYVDPTVVIPPELMWQEYYRDIVLY